MIPYELHRDAERELEAAASFYDDKLPGLGSDLVDEVQTAITSVVEHPRACPLWPNVPEQLGVHRKLLLRFPFGLAYVLPETRIVFLAVAHLSREPAYWLHRARD